MVVPVFIGKLGGDFLKLFLDAILAGHFIAALQHGGDRLRVFLPVLPQIDAAGAFCFPCVGHIKNILDFGVVPGHINEGDALAAAPHIPPHAFVPKVILGAGGGFGALGVDHKLFTVRVFVEPRRRC